MRQLILAAALAALMAPLAAMAAEPPPIEAYGRSPAASNLSLSPSGKRAAFLVTNASGRRILVQEVGGKVLVAVNPGDQKLRDISWAGDDFLLITASATVDLGPEWGFKHELEQVQVLNLKTLKTLNVFERASNISDFVLGTYGVGQRAGRWYGYFGGITLETEGNRTDAVATHGYPDLFEVDLETGAGRMVARGNERRHDWVVSPSGEVVAHSEYEEKTGRWRLLAGGGSGGRELLARISPLDDLTLIGQGRTAGTVLVQDATGDDVAFEEVQIADGKSQPVFADQPTSDLIFDRSTGLLLGARVRGPEGATMFDAGLQAKVRGALKAFPGKYAELVAYDPSFDEMVVQTDGPADSGTFWYVDIPKHSAEPLGAARPDVPAEAVGPMRMFAYKAADGLELEGVLTLPPGREAKGLPLVVMPHGGPIGIRDEARFDWWAQTYVSRGYAVFQPNYRGSSGYGLDFERAGYGEWGRKMLSDMTDGVDALAAAGVVDPHRACIVGGSYGGYAALAGVTLQHGRYRCAVAVAPVTDLWAKQRYDLDRNGADGDFARYWKSAIHGVAKDEPSLDAISPSRHAAAADAPVLLIHGKDDTVVPIDQSRTMLGALKGAGKPVEYVEMPGQDHWLTDEATRVQMLKASVAFVLKNNPP